MKELVPSDLPRVLPKLLKRISTMGLSTVDDDGLPHCVNVNFVSDDALNIYFLSKLDSAHSLHITKRAQVAVAGYVPFRLPNNIRGVQMKGHCQMCVDSQWDEHWKRFCGKFPYARPFKKMARSESFYVIQPTWVRLIDNKVRFGFKLETEWPLV